MTTGNSSIREKPKEYGIVMALLHYSAIEIVIKFIIIIIIITMQMTPVNLLVPSNFPIIVFK